MTLLAWDESYETGHEVIDQQHLDLILLLGELAALDLASSPEGEVLQVLDGLTEFTLSHFDTEEELMISVAYPDRERAEMIAQHREFLSYVRHAVLELRSGQLDRESFGTILAERLAENEFATDRKLAAFIRDAEGR